MEIETYWTLLKGAWYLVRDYGLTTMFFIPLSLVAFWILNLVKRYALAEPMGTPEESSIVIHVCRFVLNRLYGDLSDDQLRKKIWTREDIQLLKRYGYNLKGVGIDVLILEILTLVLWLTWPLLITVLIFFGPVRLCHNHFKKRRLFLARLKGIDPDEL